MGKRLDDFGTAGETMEVAQDQDRRAVGAGQRVDGTDGGQRITTGRVDFTVLAGDLQTLLDVPDGEPPIFVTAHLGDFRDGVVVLVGLDPEAGETCRNIFVKLLREGHERLR